MDVMTWPYWDLNKKGSWRQTHHVDLEAFFGPQFLTNPRVVDQNVQTP